MRFSYLTVAFVLFSASIDGATRGSSLWHMEAVVERNYRLPPGILARVRGYEKGHLAMRAERGKGAACGLYQIYVWDVASRDGQRLCSLAQGAGAPGMAAQLLDESRRWCAAHPNECLCDFDRWNWRDRVRLCKALDDGWPAES